MKQDLQDSVLILVLPFWEEELFSNRVWFLPFVFWAYATAIFSRKWYIDYLVYKVARSYPVLNIWFLRIIRSPSMLKNVILFYMLCMKASVPMNLFSHFRLLAQMPSKWYVPTNSFFRVSLLKWACIFLSKKKKIKNCGFSKHILCVYLLKKIFS